MNRDQEPTSEPWEISDLMYRADEDEGKGRTRAFMSESMSGGSGSSGGGSGSGKGKGGDDDKGSGGGAGISEAAGEAFKDGLKAAGKASKDVVEQYKNNKAFRNAFNTAIAAGMAPKAAAAYAAGGGAVMANAYRSLMQRGAAEAASRSASIPGAERAAKEAYDFATAQDPTSLPSQSIGGQLGGLASGGKDFVGNVGKLYKAAKSRFGGNSNGTTR